MRLDQLMVERGLSRSRSQAREAILRGAVTVDGIAAARPGQRVGPDTEIVAEADPYASRSAHKLIAALDHFHIDPAGAFALDVGASTGGFTDVLLRRGAAEIVALDVGHGQLVEAVAADPRVHVMEGVNARHLTADDLPYRPDLVVADVSFISLTLILPAILTLTAQTARLACLVKPQFEVGKDHIGKGGIVREDAPVAAVLARIEAMIAAAGFTILGTIPSPVPGGDGNQEYLLAAERT
ncbi:TlyA family RNA methyltransferase [Acuticoccus sp. M5D2P5]|uniref:TlyA family RNA methyltransferase n=1 Tax=Acuticoccus kalidii TaxID=2910977 RepID=UPI001F407A1E|nr:TlyA family RNA methyltransferase [Acuticoccus kalidii]MCF3934213.1 TlyA family RNA methyltransferase [Acuticoccus kalidii]